jgi:hypothetical protein
MEFYALIIKKYIEQQGKEDSGQAQLILGLEAEKMPRV